MNNVMKKIMHHLDYLLSCREISWEITQLGVDQIDEINRMLDNRERLVNIVSKLQLETESMIEDLSGSDLGPENVQIIKSWHSDTHTIVSSIIELDDKINQTLEAQKKNVANEIRATFENVEKFKGYNLQTLRK